jgi:hypothetical protein
MGRFLVFLCPHVIVADRSPRFVTYIFVATRLISRRSVYTYSPMDDEYFSGPTNLTTLRNPPALDELTSSRKLLNIAFTLSWRKDQTNV